MIRSWTLAAASLAALPLAACGDSGPASPSATYARLVLTVPPQVEGSASTNALNTTPPLAMEATVPVTIQESNGIGASIVYVSVAGRNEVTGVSVFPFLAFPGYWPLELPINIPAGEGVVFDLRVGLYALEATTLTVVIEAADEQGNNVSVRRDTLVQPGQGSTEAAWAVVQSTDAEERHELRQS